MKRDWLWDRNIPLARAKRILSHPEDPEFIELAAALLLRKNSPREVFEDYISASAFCRNWQRIKKRMKKDAWGLPRLDFWQAIYEKAKDRLKERGIIVSPPAVAIDELCLRVGEKIKDIRIVKGLSQKELAGKIGISQQMISRVEKGKENVSLITLKNIAKAMNLGVDILLSPP